MEHLHKQTINLHNLDQRDFALTGGFYDNNPDLERIYFKDPVTQEYMSPTSGPNCIELQDPMCAQGLDWLRTSGDRLNVNLLFNYHGSARDFDAFLVDPQTAPILQQAQFVAVEANFSQNGEGVLVEHRGTRRGQFQQAQMQWILREGKLALPCEIDFPQDSTKAGTLRKRMFDLFYQSNPSIDTRPDSKQAALRTLGTLYYRSIRLDMMTGQLGYWMRELEQRGCLPEQVDVPFMAGSFNTPLAERLRQYTGKMPAVYNLRPYDPAVVFAAVVNQGYVTYKQLTTLIESM